MDSLKLIFFSLTALVISKNAFASTPSAVGRVVLSKGEVVVEREGVEEVLYLMEGDIVYERDYVITKSRSILKIKFQKNGNLTLGPNSKLRLESFKKNQPGLINLLKGKLRSQVIKDGTLNEKFLVKTSNTAMGIRGTDYEVEYKPVEGSTTLAVHNGLVAMSSFYHQTLDVDVLVNHLRHGKGVLEVGGGRVISYANGEYALIDINTYNSLDEADYDYVGDFESAREVKTYRRPGNRESAIKNAELNTSGALQNGL